MTIEKTVGIFIGASHHLRSALVLSQEEIDVMREAESVVMKFAGNKRVARSINPDQPNACTRWTDFDYHVIAEAIKSDELDIPQLAHQMGRSSYAVALKAAILGYRDMTWACGFKTN